MFLFWLICVPTLCIIMAVVEYLTDDVVPRFHDTRSKRWPVNLSLMAMNVGLSLMIPFTTITSSIAGQAYDVGLLNYLNMPSWLTFPASFLYLSLHSWALHLAFHCFPMLWRFHRVHHSDYDLDFTSAFRNHPVELLIAALIGALAALVLGLDPMAAFASTMIITLISIFTHARISLPTRLERLGQTVFVTPHLHHLHHSKFRRETHSNFGGDFSLWDRLFGTLNATSSREASEFGFGLESDTPEMADDLDWVLLTPFISKKKGRAKK